MCGQPTGLYFCVFAFSFMYFEVSGIVGSLRLPGGLFWSLASFKQSDRAIETFLKLSDQFGIELIAIIMP